MVAVVFLFHNSSILDVEIFCPFNTWLFHGLSLFSSVSQQGLITTDKIYMVMRKRFEKAKVKTFTTHPRTTLHQFVVEGRGEYYFGQLSLQAFKP